MTTTTQTQPEIRIPVPPRIHAKLAEIAGFRSVEDWTRQLIIDAAEKAQPTLRSSGMWHMHVAEWLDGEDDDDE